jgi:iron(III) transport system permease protein
LSRTLVSTALVAFAVAGLLPVLAMATRVGGEDLAAIVDARTLSLMGRTLTLGVSVALLALAVGGTFGWLVARTDLPLAGVLRPLGVVPILLPTLMTAMAFVAFSELRGAAATVVVLATSSFPIVAMFTARAAERVDGRQVDAAWAAGGMSAVLRMELPLLLPPALAGACLAFVFAVNDFAVPDYVSSLGPKFNVYADEVFARWQTDHSTGSAVASALPLVLLTLAALVPALVLRRRGAARSAGQGELVAPRTLPLGRARWPLFGAAAALLLVTAVLPLGRLAWEAGGGSQGFALATLRAAFARALELARSNLG